MERIGVLTSGGDAPGMNAAVRAVVRTCVAHGREVIGVHNGYSGLMNEQFQPLSPRDVGGIIQHGGTFLGSTRCPEFRTPDGRNVAVGRLREQRISGLIVIGGDGSLAGAYALTQMGFPVVGIGATIDNDLYGSEITLGVDTALNIALEAMDRLRTTAASHHRAFLLEVMGRDCGYLAVMTGIAGGAEAVVTAEVETTPMAVMEEIRAAFSRGKSHALVVVAEGASVSVTKLLDHATAIHDQLGFELRATVLGHVQRGGRPSAFDRLLGTRLGVHAAESLLGGKHGILVGLERGEIHTTPLSTAVSKKRPLDVELLRLAHMLAR